MPVGGIKSYSSKRKQTNAIYQAIGSYDEVKHFCNMRACSFFIFIVLAVTCASSYAQQKQKRKRNSNSTSREAIEPTTLDPYYPKKEYGPKIAKGKSQKFLVYDGEKRFYERREEIAKDKRRAEKVMLNPQYSDPSYFGHRRLPKKHRPKRMKYCKECGIRH